MGGSPAKFENDDVRLDGKTAIITGSNNGIGKYTAYDFYRRGCRVIMACRNQEKAKAAQKEILSKTQHNNRNGSLVFWELDLASLASVRKCAKNILATEPQIHILVNNAGVMCTVKSWTEDGFESQFGTNHLGHFLFTLLLLPRILKSAPARIINLSSISGEYARTVDWGNLNAEKSYNPFFNYATSKMANMMFTVELAHRLKGRKVTSYAIHPGFVQTEIFRNLDSSYFRGSVWFWHVLGKFMFKTEGEGAQTTIYCALDEEAGQESGYYYADCKKKRMNRQAENLELTKKLWEVSCELVGLADFDPFTIEDHFEPSRISSSRSMTSNSTIRLKD